MSARLIVGCVMMLLAAACSAPNSTEATAANSDSAPSSAQASQSTAGATPSPRGSSTDDPSSADALLAFELVDVRTGATFTLGELAADKPVLVEAMAIWCTTCLAQQREVVEAHELTEFHSVGIDVDPNERADDLAEYAEREGFDWRFAMADTALVRLLTERYGFGVTNPPSTPTFVISADGGIRSLEFGYLRSAEELVAELAAG